MDRNFIRKGGILRLLEQEVVKQKGVNLEHDEFMFIMEMNGGVEPYSLLLYTNNCC